MDSVRVDIPARARTVHNSLLQERLEEDLYCIVCHPPLLPFPSDPDCHRTELNTCFSGDKLIPLPVGQPQSFFED